MSGDEKRRLTHLQRAFLVFERMNPQVLTARHLAELMMCGRLTTAYNYIRRLKDAKCIEQRGGSTKVPSYGVVAGAAMPADDHRGRKPRRMLEPDLGYFEEPSLPHALAARSPEK